jgi:hypothetical protein
VIEKDMYYVLTNDVEQHSIQKNRLDDETARLVVEQGLPRLLRLYEKHNIATTFFVTGEFVEKFPHVITTIKKKGHEIGCHGYSHAVDKALDTLSYEVQLHDIQRAKELVEREAGEITSFRAPALRINRDTIAALEKLGFTVDSSVASQRFDGPFTFGGRRKLKWLLAHRRPYFMNPGNPYKKGGSNILELPISALVLAHIGTVMRIIPNVDHTLRQLLFYESRVNGKPIVFNIHPNECIYEEGTFQPARRTSNLFSYFFADFIRSNLKSRNLGKKAVDLLEQEIIHAQQRGFTFVTCQQYRELYEDIHNNNG